MHGWPHSASRSLATLVAVVAVAVPGRAQAQQEDEDFVMEAGGEAPVEVELGDPDDVALASGEAEEIPPAYGFAIATEEDLRPVAHELGRTVRDLLVGSGRYSISLADGRMHGADILAADALTQARELFEGGRIAYDNLEMDEAVERFEQALQAFEEQIAHLPDIAPISDCLLYIGAAQALSGATRSARATFTRLATVDPDRQPNPDVFPPQVTGAYDQAAAGLRRIRPGSIAVTTTPEGADVYVDGVLLGPSPQSLPEAAVGSHYVRVRLPGYVAVGRSVEVRTRRSSAVELELEVTEDGPVVDELLAALPGQISERPSDAIGTVQRLGEILGVEVLVTAILSHGEGGVEVEYGAWNVLRGERVAHRTSGPFETADAATIVVDAPSAVDALAAAAWTSQRVMQADDVPLVRARPQPEPERAVRPPVWRRWWFWTVIGAAAVGAGVGIGLGVASATAGPERTDGQLILDL